MQGIYYTKFRRVASDLRHLCTRCFSLLLTQHPRHTKPLLCRIILRMILSRFIIVRRGVTRRKHSRRARKQARQRASEQFFSVLLHSRNLPICILLSAFRPCNIIRKSLALRCEQFRANRFLAEQEIGGAEPGSYYSGPAWASRATRRGRKIGGGEGGGGGSGRLCGRV